jgi:Holliday junction resolvase
MNTKPRTIVASETLAPIIDEANARRTAYRRRKDENDYVKIHPADEQKYASEKWQPHKATQTHLWLKRRKSFDRLLEDQVWCLFYKMGYPVLNGPRFRIQYKRSDGTTGAKQIDVFAKDDETAIVVECKARESRGRRPLQKDLHETENLQKGFSQAIRSHFGNGYNPKIIWIYATSNIIWAEKDLERAEAANIRVITENELQYFEAFIGHIGTAGRYQFLAEFLEGQQIPGMENVKVPAVRGKFGPHTYYSFVVSARHLLKIAFVNHQALNHPDGKPAYQRMINKKRISDIGTFIQKGG